MTLFRSKAITKKQIEELLDIDKLMDKAQANKIVALLLCSLLFVMYLQNVWLPYFRGAPEQPVVEQTELGRLDSRVEVSQQEEDTRRPQNPTDQQLAENGYFEIETDVFVLRISRLGGRITSLVLKEFKAQVGSEENLELVRHSAEHPYPLGVYLKDLNDSWIDYELTDSPPRGQLDYFRVAGGDRAEFVLTGELPDGRPVKKSLTVGGSNYVVDLVVSIPDETPLAVEWTKSVSKETSFFEAYSGAGFVWFDGDRAHHEGFSKSDARRSIDQAEWLTLADKYFMATLISPAGLRRAEMIEGELVHSSQMSAMGPDAEFRIFAGPKDYALLEALGQELKRSINFGWSGFIAVPLLSLLNAFYRLFGNYGLAIIALTILVKTLLYPLNAASYRHMKSMQDLQPEMKRIREQVKDKQQQQMEMMALYKKTGVNPMGGCLPMLLQFPVFIGLYMALQLSIQLRHAPFAIWIQDLASPERCEIFGIGVPIMVILFVASMLIQMWTMPTTADPTQKKVMMVMPIMFGFFFVNFPAGLTLYWLVNNLISIGQQRALYKNDSKLAMKITAGVAIGIFLFAYILTLI